MVGRDFSKRSKSSRATFQYGLEAPGLRKSRARRGQTPQTSTPQRQLTRLEQKALGWLLNSPDLGPFLSSLQRQARQLLEFNPRFDSPLSPKQWSHLLAAYDNHLKSMEFETRRTRSDSARQN